MNPMIFVIEPDHDTRVQIRAILEAASFLVVSTTNGLDALQLLPNTSKPFAILLSSAAPLMSAADFVNVFRKNAEYVQIPVFLIVSNGAEKFDGIAGAIRKSELAFDLADRICQVFGKS